MRKCRVKQIFSQFFAIFTLQILLYINVPPFFLEMSILDAGVSLRKKCLYSELFWSVFSRIPTEYGEALRISQSECGKMRTRITPNTENLYAVFFKGKRVYFNVIVSKNTQTGVKKIWRHLFREQNMRILMT